MPGSNVVQQEPTTGVAAIRAILSSAPDSERQELLARLDGDQQTLASSRVANAAPVGKRQLDLHQDLDVAMDSFALHLKVMAYENEELQIDKILQNMPYI